MKRYQSKNITDKIMKITFIHEHQIKMDKLNLDAANACWNVPTGIVSQTTF